MIKKYLISACLASTLGGILGCTQEPNPPIPPEPVAAEISITEPKNEDSVSEYPVFKGQVADPNAQVWIVVHPMEIAEYWVQQPVTVSSNGSWETQPNIGRPGNVDDGKRFEVMAIVNPESPLTTGDKLKIWPEAQGQSDVIRVTRQ